MPNKNHCQSSMLFAVSAFILGGFMPSELQASPSMGIHCQVINGIPSTVSKTAKRTVPIINWKSGTFSASGYTPQRRCEEVSGRFEAFRQKGQLKYLTTGRENGQNIICVAARQNGPCVGTLYTLKPGQNPNTTLSNLLNVRRGASGALSESPGRVYVKFTDLESRSDSQAVIVQPATPTGSGKVRETPPPAQSYPMQGGETFF